MLLLHSLAWAAPVAAPLEATPIGSVNIAFEATSLRDHLHQVGCTEGQCNALSVDNRLGGFLEYRPLSFLSLYGRGHSSDQKLRSADYYGTGWGVAGGAKLGVPLGNVGGLEGWVEYATLSTGELSSGNTRQISQVEAGVVYRYGRLEDGILLWGGAEMVPWAADQPVVLGGTFPVDLAPSFPMSATGGVSFVSNPLGPAWSDRGRVEMSTCFNLGNQVFFGMELGALY